MWKFLGKHWLKILFAFVVVGLIWSFVSFTKAQVENEIKEKIILEKDEEREEAIQDHIESIDRLMKQINKKNQIIHGVKKEIKELQNASDKIQSVTASQLRKLNATKNKILKEKIKDEKKIKLLNKQIDNWIIIDKENQRIIKAKDSIITMWKGNYFEERDSKLDWKKQYFFLKKKAGFTKKGILTKLFKVKGKFLKNILDRISFLNLFYGIDKDGFTGGLTLINVRLL